MPLSCGHLSTFLLLYAKLDFHTLQQSNIEGLSLSKVMVIPGTFRLLWSEVLDFTFLDASL